MLCIIIPLLQGGFDTGYLYECQMYTDEEKKIIKPGLNLNYVLIKLYNFFFLLTYIFRNIYVIYIYF